ncbi:hypothetical protein BN1723_020178, partial [Verticillium longisporum]
MFSVLPSPAATTLRASNYHSPTFFSGTSSRRPTGSSSRPLPRLPIMTSTPDSCSTSSVTSFQMAGNGTWSTTSSTS